jgi:glycosyltransferase involved in cell wall biosynthesis
VITQDIPGMVPRYVVISPVRDEARHIEHTLKSMASQTLKPAAWIIVDDGSTDATAEIVGRYVQKEGFIRLSTNSRIGPRQPGAAVIQAFNRGCELIGSQPYDFIVKLDCDLSFAPDYFEKLIGRFSADARLGIASGVYFEKDKNGAWRMIDMPAYHAFGACKVVRRQCFEDIGGFVAAKGWDTVDEIRAVSRGWTTRHFVDLETRHHKPEGTGIGVLKTSRMHGEIYYATGGDPLFFVLKCLRRLAVPPRPLNALALVQGYVRAAVSRKSKLVTTAEARCYRTMLWQRLSRSDNKQVTAA